MKGAIIVAYSKMCKCSERNVGPNHCMQDLPDSMMFVGFNPGQPLAPLASVALKRMLINDITFRN